MAVGIAGLKEYNEKLKSLEKVSAKTAYKEVAKAAYGIQRKAKRNCVVLTGRLRSSIAAEVYKTSLTGGSGAEIGTNVYYAPFVEYGTVRSRPKPFLWPALIAQRPEMVKSMKEAMVKELNETWDKESHLPTMAPADWFLV